MSFGKSSQPSAPKPKTINIGQMEQMGIEADKRGYALSDADWRRRFPLLDPADRAALAGGISELGGALPKASTDALRTAGLGTEAGRIATGNEFATARNLGEDILSKEQRDRNYFETELALHPARKFGPGGSGAIQMLEANTGMKNQYAQAAYGTQLQNYQTGLLQQAQNFAALGNVATGITKDVMAYEDPYTNPFVGGAYTPNYAPPPHTYQSDAEIPSFG